MSFFAAEIWKRSPTWNESSKIETGWSPSTRTVPGRQVVKNAAAVRSIAVTSRIGMDTITPLGSVLPKVCETVTASPIPALPMLNSITVFSPSLTPVTMNCSAIENAALEPISKPPMASSESRLVEEP